MLLGQLAHVRLAVLESSLIKVPAWQTVCAVHEVDVCELDAWNVFAGQVWQSPKLSLYCSYEQAPARNSFNLLATSSHAAFPAGTIRSWAERPYLQFIVKVSTVKVG